MAGGGWGGPVGETQDPRRLGFESRVWPNAKVDFCLTFVIYVSYVT